LFNVCDGANALGDSQRNEEILIGDGWFYPKPVGPVGRQ
jgi:hypothetical protein